MKFFAPWTWRQKPRRVTARLRLTAAGTVRLIVPERGGFVVLPLDRIRYLETCPGGCRVVGTDGSVVRSSERLDHFELLLREHHFQRAGRRRLINVNF